MDPHRFYDHVAPGATVPPGDSVTDPVNNHHDFDFAQLGVRVPTIVCSPWIPKNVIDHRHYEHASVPATIERLWDLPNMTDRDEHARDLIPLLPLSAPRTDARTTLPDAAEPEASCDGDEDQAETSSGLTASQPGETLLDSVALARARQRNATAITSSAAGFLRVALRRDLLLAPLSERPAIFEQARGFDTMGEVGEYGRRVVDRINRSRTQRPRVSGRSSSARFRRRTMRATRQRPGRQGGGA